MAKIVRSWWLVSWGDAMRFLCVILLGAGLLCAPAFLAPAKAQDQQQDPKQDKKDKKDKKKKDKQSGEEAPAQPKDVNRELSQMLRELQFSLEGGSSRGFLALIDAAKFDDYPRFEDMVERLAREDIVRAYFRTVTTSPNVTEGKAQTILDAEMELTRKNAVGQAQRRRQQLTLDFELTRRGWRITNITPRNYFEPL